MKLNWQIDGTDVSRVKALIASQAEGALIRARQAHNLAESKPVVTKERLWRAMVAMRLTTRQKSGPESHVARFIRLSPFPLAYEIVQAARDARVLIAKALRKAGGIRFADKIASELAQNLDELEAACGLPRLPNATGWLSRYREKSKSRWRSIFRRAFSASDQNSPVTSCSRWD